MMGPAEASSFVGGMRWPAGPGTLGGNASLPLARLRVDGRGVHLGPNGRVMLVLARVLLMPTYEVPWSEVRQVERLPRGGIRFVLAQPEQAVIFWTLDPERVLQTISAVQPGADGRALPPPSARARQVGGPWPRRKKIVIGTALVAATFGNLLWTLVGMPLSVAIMLCLIFLVPCTLGLVVVAVIPESGTRGR